MQRRIAAVFATMNRRETAVSCLKALAAQTHPPDLVVVADNVSSDHTAEALEQVHPLPFRMIVHRMTENRGNAGGIEEAMEIAFGAGCDAVWILDDDSWPRPDALAALLDPEWSDDEVRHSIQLDPKTGDLTWPMQVFDREYGWRVIGNLRDLRDSPNVITRNNWTGSLVTRRVRERVGPVNGALFIRGEDEEYPWRFQKAGIGQRAATGSILDHPGPPFLMSVRFLGRNLYFEPGLSDWKLYYKIRNMVWLQMLKKGGIHAFAMAIAYAWVIARNDGFHRMGLVGEACIDGWKGSLGRWSKHPC